MTMRDEGPFYRRLATPSIGAAGRRYESRLSDRIGASLTPSSGSTEHSKGDMVLDELLIEAKSTIHRSIQLKLDWLVKIKREALERGKTAVLSLSFTDKRGKAESEWVVIPMDLFMEMRDAVRKQDIE